MLTSVFRPSYISLLGVKTTGVRSPQLTGSAIEILQMASATHKSSKGMESTPAPLAHNPDYRLASLRGCQTVSAKTGRPASLTNFCITQNVPFLTTLLSSFNYLSLTYDILWQPPPTLPFLLMNWFIWKGNANVPGEQGQTTF